MRYIYRAKNSDGEIVTGSVKAESESDATKIIIDHSLTPVLVIPEKVTILGNIFNRISTRDKAIFSRQLSTMLAAGLPLTKALSILASTAKNDYLRNVFLDLYHDVEEGYSLSISLSRQPLVFDRVFISVVNSGEKTGKLDLVLDQLSQQLENSSRFITKVKASLYYPAFIVLVLILIGIYLMAAVVPKIKLMFDQYGQSLPAITKVLLAISVFVENWWWAILLVFALLFMFIKFWTSTEGGIRFLSLIQMKIPGLNKLFEGVYIYRFAKTMQLLVSSGVPLVDAIKISSTVMNNPIYEESLLNVAHSVERGVPLSVQLTKERLFPSILNQMVAIGEESGELEKVLGKVADYYEESTSDVVRVISTLVEPTILILVGLAVAFMVFAIVIPVYNLAQIS